MGETDLKKLIGLVFFVFSFAPIDQASADCADINRQITAAYSAIVAAKDAFAQDTLNAAKQGTSRSPDEAMRILSEAIASTEKMKQVEDNAIDVLQRAQAERCFGSEADKWATGILSFKEKSNELGETISMYRQQRSEIQKKYGLR